MRFELLTPHNADLWDAFVKDSDDAWLYHTYSMMRLYQEYIPETQSLNLSFFVYDDDNRLIGICPLFLEKNTYGGDVAKEFSSGRYALPNPALHNELSLKQRNETQRSILDHVDVLAAQEGVSRSTFQLSPLLPSHGKETGATYNWFVKYDYLDSFSIKTQILHCQKSPEDVRKGMRKGHSADIKRAFKLMEFKVFNFENITKEIFGAYQNLHFKAAGRMTRPQVTFDLMFEMIMKDQMFLVGAEKEGRFIGFGLFEFFKKRACYSSAANDAEFGTLPISHGIQAVAIEWLQNHECELYELGWQNLTPQLNEHPSEKEKNISHFKRGFGGTTHQIYVGEKYYSPQFFKEIWNKRLSDYAEARFK